MCKRNIEWLPLTGSVSTRDLICNPGICQESNWWPFGLQDNAQHTEPHQSGLRKNFCDDSFPIQIISKMSSQAMILVISETILNKQYPQYPIPPSSFAKIINWISQMHPLPSIHPCCHTLGSDLQFISELWCLVIQFQISHVVSYLNPSKDSPLLTGSKAF